MPWFVMLIAAIFLSCAIPAQADSPRQLRLSFIEDARSSMGVAWTTNDFVGSVVQYGLDTSYGQEQQSAADAHLVTDIGYVHEVLLTGLSAATTYHYRVGDGTDWSADASFTTAKSSPCAPWRFIAMGDNRTQFGEGGHDGVSKNFPPILTEALEHNPNFILNSGDLVLDGHLANQWVDYLDTTEPFAQNIPMFTAMGNHDDDSEQGDGAKYNGIFYLPRNDDNGFEDYFSYRYENALFVVLSTQTFNDSGTSGNPFGRQAEFMERAFQANPDVTWRIVAYHHPSYTGGGTKLLGYDIGHKSNENLQNAAFLPIFDRYHVDFVLTGHNHWYERFYPLTQGSDLTLGEVQSSPDDGTIYITTGGAGAYTSDLSSIISSFDLCENEELVGSTRAFCRADHHYAVFDFSDRSVDVEVWSTSCQNVGCDHTPELIDSLSFTKSGASQCTAPVDAGYSDDAASAADAHMADVQVADAAVDDAAVASDAALQTDSALADDAAEARDAQIINTDATQTATGHDASVETAPGPAQNVGCACSSQRYNTRHAGFALLLLLGLVAIRRRIF